MGSIAQLKSRIGAALNDVDRRLLSGLENLDFSALRAEHDLVIERFREEADAAGITDYLMRTVLSRTVGWGCQFVQPYEVMTPLADRFNQYPPYSEDDAINSGMVWFRYVLDQGRVDEASEQIEALEALIPKLTKSRQKWLTTELVRMRTATELP